MNYTIENNGKKYDYQIRPLSAWQWSNTLLNLTQMITSTEQFSAKNIMAAINMLAQNGTPAKDVKQEQMAEVIGAFQSGKFDLLFDIAIGVLNSATEDKQQKIFDSALSAIWFNNGNPAMGGGMIQLSLANIDMYITHPVDLLLLVKESLMYNYKSVFDRFFSKAPNSK